jgi:hypothetical protein
MIQIYENLLEKAIQKRKKLRQKICDKPTRYVSAILCFFKIRHAAGMGGTGRIQLIFLFATST